MPIESPELRDGREREPAAIRKTLTMGAAVLAAALSLGVVSGGIPMPSAMSLLPSSQHAVRLADFGEASPSPEARHVADWVADSRDNADADFIIVDKRDARVYVFDPDARLRAASPVLLGAAVGDDSVPDIGLRPIEDVLPEERTTPAGRFIAERGRNLQGEDVVWVDYDAAVSMHRVRATKPSEQRLERLATPTVDDNRISYGCINVPVAFYESYVSPTVATRRAIVYVLPEVKPVQQVFGSYDVSAPRRHALLK
ncbi:MAG: hypothetical protein Q7J36_16095 [Thiobacillus sp.]|nr:hypothetical protein [Thiobacillus sp.]